MDALNHIINYLVSFFNTRLTVANFVDATYETVIMVLISLIIGALLGIPLGICLVTTRPSGLLANRGIYNLLNPTINMVRSLPFIILMVAIAQFTALIVGKSYGVAAAIVPLTIYVTPYIARLVENSLLEVNGGIIEAAQAMGATPLQIIWHFMLPEAFSSLILTLTTATIGLIGASAMAGAIGAGGIGDLAVTYGYRRFDNTAIVVSVIILIIIVQCIQSIGNYLARKARHE